MSISFNKLSGWGQQKIREGLKLGDVKYNGPNKLERAHNGDYYYDAEKVTYLPEKTFKKVSAQKRAILFIKPLSKNTTKKNIATIGKKYRRLHV